MGWLGSVPWPPFGLDPTWPIAILNLAICFRRALLDLVNRLRQVKVSAVEFLIAEVAEKKQLPVSARAERSGLSANEIWALNDFSIGNIAVLVTK